MTHGRQDHQLSEHAAEAKALGRVIDVLALQMPSGEVPHRAALQAAQEIALEGPGTLACFAAAATIPSAGKSERAGILLVVRQATSAAKPTGTAVSRGTGLFTGVATGHGHGEAAFDDLVAVAMEGLGVARSDGGDLAVHSELYELVQVMRGRSPRPNEYSAPEHGKSGVTPQVQTRLQAAPTAAPVAVPIATPIAIPAPTLVNGPEPVPASAPTTSPDAAQESSPSSERGIRTESDDPFAYVDTRDDALNDARAAALTRGIAPGDQELAELARSHIEERDAVRDELQRLRADGAGQQASDVQERRIQKLARQLEAAEEEINKLRSHQEGDPGLASFFSSVQGLDPNEPNAHTKRGMLDNVFRENTGEAPAGPAGPEPSSST